MVPWRDAVSTWWHHEVLCRTGLMSSPDGRVMLRPLSAMDRLVMAQPSPQMVERSPSPAWSCMMKGRNDRKLLKKVHS